MKIAIFVSVMTCSGAAVLWAGCSSSSSSDASGNDDAAIDGADGASADVALNDAALAVDSGDGGLESIGIVNDCVVPPISDAGINVTTNLVYATMDGQPQSLDVAWPMSGANHPLVVLIHGGAWQVGNKNNDEDELYALAGLGYTAATLNYRLVHPECPTDGGVGPDGGVCHANIFPAPVQDVRCAVRWLKTNAATYAIDPSRVAALGDSVGGHLAAMLGTALNEPGLDGPCPLTGSPDPSVIAVVPFYGPEDLYNWDPAYASASDVADLLGTPAYNSNPTLAALASPIDHVTPQTPPFLMLHGTADKTVPYAQSVAMRAKLQANGVPATLVTLVDAGHAFPTISTDPEYRASTCTSLAFLKAYLKP